MSHKGDFEQLSLAIRKRIEFATTEEAIKTSCVLPLFAFLGYDVFNPEEFCPEYTCDVGTKKGEKVDFAILSNNDPIILIECKHHTQDLDRHINQLFRYFTATNAQFAVLTDGLTYKFFTDTHKTNIMDLSPFFEFNVISCADYQLAQLLSFHKEYFHKEYIRNTIFGIQNIRQLFQNHKDEISRLSAESLSAIKEIEQKSATEISNLQIQIESLTKSLQDVNSALARANNELNLNKQQEEVIDSECIAGFRISDLVEYLNMPVPNTWPEMSLNERREYWNGDRAKWRGSVRAYICSSEVACEFFNFERGDIGVGKGRMIANALRRTKIYFLSGRKKGFSYYGSALAWVHKSVLSKETVMVCRDANGFLTTKKISGKMILQRVRSSRNSK